MPVHGRERVHGSEARIGVALLAIFRCARSDRPRALQQSACWRPAVTASARAGLHTPHAPHFDRSAVELLAPMEDFLLPRLRAAIEDQQVGRIRAAPIDIPRTWIRFALPECVRAPPNVSICHTDGLPAHGAVSAAGRPGAQFRTGGRTNPWPVDRTLDSRSASKSSRERASGATKRNASSSARRSECLMAADLPSKPSTPRTWACLR